MYILNSSSNSNSINNSINSNINLNLNFNNKDNKLNKMELLNINCSSSLSSSFSPSSSSEELCSIKGANILVVEDDPLNRIIALKFLKKLGHNVTLAENGLSAFNLVSSTNFDLILMDVNMPVMDGKESTKRIREYESRAGKRTPIIGLTTMPKDECIDAGMDDHLFKPAKFNLLDEKVSFYLKKSQASPLIISNNEQLDQQLSLSLPSSEPSSPSIITIKSDIQIVSINSRDKYISSPDLSIYFKNISNNNTNVNSLSSSCNSICSIKEINEDSIDYINNNNNNHLNSNNINNSFNISCNDNHQFKNIKNCNNTLCNNNHCNNFQSNNNSINNNTICIFNTFVNTDIQYLNNNSVLSNINNIKNNYLNMNSHSSSSSSSSPSSPSKTNISNDNNINNNNNNNNNNNTLNRRRKFVSRSTSQPSFFSNKEYTIR